MTRPTRARVNLEALTRNYALLKRTHGGSLLAVLKANAYGHGAVCCATALDKHADGFAVALMPEALQLRSAGVRSPILVLQGAFDAQELEAARVNDVWLVVHHEEQLRMIELLPGHSQLNVWLKVDSGMARLGFPIADTASAYERLRGSDKVARVTLMTHFARADEPDCPTTRQQIEAFESACQHTGIERSLCNSAGLLRWAGARAHWGRAGIALYGVEPAPGYDHGLDPVMTLESTIVAVRSLIPGDALGYGHSFVAQRSSRIGLVPVGYADGYPRAASNGAPISVNGQLTTVVGRVSMDVLAVDLTDLPNVGAAAHVQLWGDEVNIDDVASHAGTIPYELLCNVKRVPLLYEHGTSTRSV